MHTFSFHAVLIFLINIFFSDKKLFKRAEFNARSIQTKEKNSSSLICLLKDKTLPLVKRAAF